MKQKVILTAILLSAMLTAKSAFAEPPFNEMGLCNPTSKEPTYAVAECIAGNVRIRQTFNTTSDKKGQKEQRNAAARDTQRQSQSR
ncbi:MAG: hypothetical protein D6808_07110 [Candidatus Dadabacteria bacterium]|nr:MAG: hypothetical protein D6808_07110 [Candidatus Dadabacteria bacterium]